MPEDRKEYLKEYRKRPEAKERKRLWDKSERGRAWSSEYRRKRREAILADPDKKRKLQEKERRRHLRNTFGITPEHFDLILKSQRGVCAICQSTTPGKGIANWHVDHDHETGRIRGILCGPCNTALGLIGDSESRVNNWIGNVRNYLTQLPSLS